MSEPPKQPPKPLGSGEGPLPKKSRNAVIAAAVVVTVYAAACLWRGWDHPVGTVALVFIYLGAGLASFFYLVSQWLGRSAQPPTGFQVGGVIYLAPRKTAPRQAEACQRQSSKAPTEPPARIASCISKWVPWPLREPFFRLPVLLSVVWAAATFALVDHRVPGDIYGQLEPTLIALLVAVIAVNGFLAVRGQHTIDFLGALATVLVLIAGVTISLVQIAGASNNEVQWVAGALVFGVVAILQTGIHGADSPDGGEPDTETQSPQLNDLVPEKVPDTGTVGTEPPSAESCPEPLHCCPKPPHCHSPTQRRRINLLAAAGVLAVLVLAGIAGSLVQKHFEGTAGADCLAFDTQFAQLASNESLAFAVQAMKDDDRRTACQSTLGRIEKTPPITECIAFLAEIDQLVDDEPIKAAAAAIAHDPHTRICHPDLGLLAQR